MPLYAIYEIRNVSANRVYVGATSQFKIRIRAHFGIARRGEKEGHPLYDDIRKFGEGCFNVSVLEECGSLVDAQIAEAKWVQRLNATDRDCGYNTAPGGDDLDVRAGIALAKRQALQALDPETFRKNLSDRARKGHLQKTAEERSDIARKRFFARSEEDRARMSKAGADSKSPETHRQAALKRQRNYTADQRASIMSAMREGFRKLTAEQLQARSRKGWEARRAKTQS